MFLKVLIMSVFATMRSDEKERLTIAFKNVLFFSYEIKEIFFACFFNERIVQQKVLASLKK